MGYGKVDYKKIATCPDCGSLKCRLVPVDVPFIDPEKGTAAFNNDARLLKDAIYYATDIILICEKCNITRRISVNDAEIFLTYSDGSA